MTNRPFPRYINCTSVSKRVFVQNLPYDSTFDLHENEPIGGTHFDMNSLARRLVLIQRQKVTRKWPIPVNPRPLREFRSCRDCAMVHSGLTTLFFDLIINNYWMRLS